jgi:tetratricopeptide (TPR) repeat protein
MGRKKRKQAPKHTTHEQHTRRDARKQERQQEQTVFAQAKEQLGEDLVGRVGYVITTEPLEDEWSHRLSPQLDAQIDSLHRAIASDPRWAVTELSQLITRYPDHPILYNFLSAAYGRCGDMERKDAAVLACYEKFPTYLYGQINYAQYCLEHGQMRKIPALFGDPPGLHHLCPSRKAFHVSEFVGFARVVGLYYVLTGRMEQAKLLYQDAKRMAPHHPATKRLGRVLYPSWWRRMLARLMGNMLKRKMARMASSE